MFPTAHDILSLLYSEEGKQGVIEHTTDRHVPIERYDKMGIPIPSDTPIKIIINGVDSIDINLITNDRIAIKSTEALTIALRDNIPLFTISEDKVKSIEIFPYIYNVLYFTQNLSNISTETIQTSHTSDFERFNLLYNSMIEISKSDTFIDRTGRKYSIEEIIYLEEVITQLLCKAL